jgi:hypothetical protein
MKRLIWLATRLYPSAWRERYGLEFEALLEDANSGGGDLWDVLRGALLMRITRINFVTITAAFALAGVLAAGVWSLLSPVRFVSTTVMRASGARVPAEPEAALRLLFQAEQQALSRGSLSNLIQKVGLYPAERAKLPLEDIIQRMRQSDIRIRVVDRDAGSLRLEVEFADSDAARSERATAELASALRTELGKTGKFSTLDAIPQPVRQSPVDTKRLIVGGLLGGMTAGLVCGTLWALARNRQRWSFRRVAAFAGVGMAAGVAVSIAIPNQYISSAVVRYTADQAQTAAMLKDVLSDAALAGILRREGVYVDELKRKPIGELTADLRKRIRVQIVAPAMTPQYSALVFSVMDPNRTRAQQINRALVSALLERNLAGGSLVEVQVLDPPSDPASPASPNRVLIVALGAVAGVLLGLALAGRKRPDLATA